MHATPPLHAKLPFESVLLIANPISGRGRGERAAHTLRELLRAEGLRTQLCFTCKRGDGARFAREYEADLVIVVGGDGTLSDVLLGLPEQVPITVLSMGTANVMARDLGLPRTAEAMVRMLRNHALVGLDVAEVGERRSFLVTGVGIDGAIVRSVEARRRGSIRKWSYVYSTLVTLLRWRPPRLSVAVDGQQIPGNWAWVLVSNIIGYGGFLKLSPDRKLDDGLFEVYLFPRATRWALLCYGLRGVIRRLPGGDCKMLRAREVRIESETEVPYQVDGDYGGMTPVAVRWNGRRHHLCVPR